VQTGLCTAQTGHCTETVRIFVDASPVAWRVGSDITLRTTWAAARAAIERSATAALFGPASGFAE